MAKDYVVEIHVRVTDEAAVLAAARKMVGEHDWMLCQPYPIEDAVRILVDNHPNPIGIEIQDSFCGGAK